MKNSKLRVENVLKDSKNKKQIISLIATFLILGILMVLPVKANPYAIIEGLKQFYKGWTYELTVKLCIPQGEYIKNFDPYSVDKICLMNGNNELFCSSRIIEKRVENVSYTQDYGYGYAPRWGYGFYGYGYGYEYGYFPTSSSGCFMYKVEYTFGKTGTFTINKIRFYSGSNYIDVSTNKTYQINIVEYYSLSGGGTTTITTGGGGGKVTEEKPKENVTKKMKELGIEKVVKKMFGIENVSKVEVVSEKKIRVRARVEARIEGGIKVKLEEMLQTRLGKKVNVSVEPLTVEVYANVIKVVTKDNKTIYLTKIVKEVNKSDVIEYIPKSLANNTSEVTIVSGNILSVLESDPILELQPENNTIAYVVQGNKVEYANETATFTYTYQVIEQPVQNATQPVTQQPVTNVTPTKPTVQPTQNVTNVTKVKPKKEGTNLWIIVGVLIAIILAIVGYLVKIGKIKIPSK